VARGDGDRAAGAYQRGITIELTALPLADSTCLAGDRVRVEVSVCDQERGRIVGRNWLFMYFT
jgi:hypothetical protein